MFIRTFNTRFAALAAPVLMMALASAVSAQDSLTPPAPPTPPTPESQKSNLEYVQLTIEGAVTGDIVLELNREKAPISTDNFLSYVDKKFYEGTIFHRVISTFMIQGGGFTKDMQQTQTDPPIKNEWKNGLKNTRGTIAMARTKVIDSATSQFFINVVDNPVLDQPRDGAAYAVFGKVVAGMEVVNKIRDLPTTFGPDGEKSKPLEIASIAKAVRLSEEDAKKLIDAEKKPDAPTSPVTPPTAPPTTPPATPPTPPQ